METLGINIGYLVMQLACFGIFIGLFVLVMIVMARYLSNKTWAANKTTLLRTETVTDDGVTIPTSLLYGAKQVEIREQNGRLLIIPLEE
ncbi:MAG: hypothetical protein GY796_35870 [Chloroflexi bacterium]|nr:hypothetical protein [Chloroflexota bacterium]